MDIKQIWPEIGLMQTPRWLSCLVSSNWKSSSHREVSNAYIYLQPKYLEVVRMERGGGGVGFSLQPVDEIFTK